MASVASVAFSLLYSLLFCTVYLLLVFCLSTTMVKLRNATLAMQAALGHWYTKTYALKVATLGRYYSWLIYALFVSQRSRLTMLVSIPLVMKISS